MEVALPVATSLLTVFKGYKAVTTVVTAFRTVSAATEGASTGVQILGTAIQLFTGKTICAFVPALLCSTFISFVNF